MFRDGTKKNITWWLRKGIDEANGREPDQLTQDTLQTFGLKLLKNPVVDRAETPNRWLEGWHVAVSSSHAMTSVLFAGSKWEAPPGTPGGWIGSMKRVPGAALSKKQIDRMSRNCVLVPIDAFITQDKDSAVLADESREDRAA